MPAVIIVEIKGFAALSTELARSMSAVAVTPERVRAALIEIINEVGSFSSAEFEPTHSAHIGGDTWYFQHDKAEAAARFACKFLNRCRELVTVDGLFYLKPSVALALGEPKLSDGRFLDDESIGAYRLADGGKPFHLYIHPNAVQAVSAIEWLPIIQGGPLPDGATLGDWQTAQLKATDDDVKTKILLPALLLDSEVIYSRTAAEAISNIIRQQSVATSICAFGGPVPADVPFYRSYLRETLLMLGRDNSVKFSILSYVPVNEGKSSYFWLELCRRLAIRFSDRFSFSAFIIPEGQLRPFSFQIFDQKTVHLGLRSYSMQSGTPKMSSAIMIINRNIAERFYSEYVENFRKIGSLSDIKFGEIVSKLEGVSNSVKRESMENIDDLFSSVYNTA